MTVGVLGRLYLSLGLLLPLALLQLLPCHAHSRGPRPPNPPPPPPSEQPACVAAPLSRAGVAIHERVPRSSGPVGRGGCSEQRDAAWAGRLGLGRPARSSDLQLWRCAGGRQRDQEERDWAWFGYTFTWAECWAYWACFPSLSVFPVPGCRSRRNSAAPWAMAGRLAGKEKDMGTISYFLSIFNIG